ncbi:hypothetical protein F4559_003341 [Saccharothrix violaceirubra]|uniref:Uncharacterized protein n=1 Tax=Saccharothrix violaceirubra TaxID=413306 RepID=A0A7W7T4Q1_9PSEU|nr:hypothetical protein [Saccharothrix violaceirubra]
MARRLPQRTSTTASDGPPRRPETFPARRQPDRVLPPAPQGPRPPCPRARQAPRPVGRRLPPEPAQGPRCAPGMHRGVRPAVRADGRLAHRTTGRDRSASVAHEGSGGTGPRRSHSPALRRVLPGQGRIRRPRRTGTAPRTGGPSRGSPYRIRPRDGVGSTRRRPGPPGDRPRRGHRHQSPCPGLRTRERPPAALHRAHRHRGPRPVSRRERGPHRLQPPARPTSAVEQGVYDSGGSMLRDFLDGLAVHLEPGGEGWLILSDLAERLGLRTRSELLAGVKAAGLHVVDRTDTRPRHPRARDTADPLHSARVAEVTSLWRLSST